MLTDLLSIILGYRAGEWRMKRKVLQRPEFWPFPIPLRLSYRAECQVGSAPFDRKCAEPATGKWNNYDCGGKFCPHITDKDSITCGYPTDL